jgi:hypothetical protein
MEDDLNIILKGRTTSFISFKLETMSIFSRIGDDIIYFGKWKTTSIIMENGRQPQFLEIWKSPKSF